MFDFHLMMEQWKKIVPFFLVITLFVIPISPTLKSIFIPLSLISVILIPNLRQDVSSVLKEHWCKAAIAFFSMVLLACLWSPAELHLRLEMIGKYSKLLYLPLFAVCFTQSSTRQYGIYAFLFAMVITCIYSLCKPVDTVVVFHNHIVTSFMMAFAAYLASLEAMRLAGFKRIFFIVLVLLFSYQLFFINQGRSGYGLYFVLMLFLMMMYLPAKHSLIAILICSCSFFIILNQSSVLSTRIYDLVEDIQLYQQGEKNTSMGTRIVFHKFAKSLFLTSPLIGHGSGGFAYAFNHRKERELTRDWRGLLDPHSQYWLVAADFGLLGLGILCYFFISLWGAALQLKRMQPVMLGLLISFFLANFTDSLLFYSVIGNLFIVFSALCLGELIEQKKWLVDDDKRLTLSSKTATCPIAS